MEALAWLCAVLGPLYAGGLWRRRRYRAAALVGVLAVLNMAAL